MINGKRIRELLREKGMTESELAVRLGVSGAMMSYIINGLRDTTVSKLVRIAEELDCALDELIYRQSV